MEATDSYFQLVSGLLISVKFNQEKGWGDTKREPVSSTLDVTKLTGTGHSACQRKLERLKDAQLIGAC